MEQPWMLPILHCHYHACWCPDNWRSQGINRHSIDSQRWNILSPALEELRKSEWVYKVIISLLILNNFIHSQYISVNCLSSSTINTI